MNALRDGLDAVRRGDLVNEIGPGGWSALHLAAFYGPVEVVDILLELHNDSGQTALDLSGEHRLTALPALLQPRPGA